MEPSKIKEFVEQCKNTGDGAKTCTQKWVQAMYDIGVNAWNPVNDIWPSGIFLSAMNEHYPETFPIIVDIWLLDMQMEWRSKNPSHISCS